VLAGRFWSFFLAVATTDCHLLQMEENDQAPSADAPPQRGPVAIVTAGNVSIKIYKVKAKSAASGYNYKFAADGHPSVTRADLDELKLEAKRTAVMISSGVTAHVQASDISELMAARRLAEERDTPLLPAMQEWSKAKELTGPALLSVAQEHADAKAEGKHQRITLRAAWDKFFEVRDKLGYKATQSYGAKANIICRGLGGGTMVDTLTTDGVAKWAEDINDNVTRNDLLGRLGMLLRWCKKAGHLPKDRAIATDDVDRGKEPPATIGTLTAPQFKKVLELIRRVAPHYLAATAMTGFSGIRSQELHGKQRDKNTKRKDMPRQRWDDIHVNKKWTGGHFNVSVAKEGTPAWRLVPISPALAAWLKICPRVEGDPYVCIAGAIERVREICREAKKRGELDFDMPENCFRHSAISFKIPFIGVSKCAEESGNSGGEIIRRYRRPCLKSVAKKWWDIRPDPARAPAL
jgi:hypothetical protein